MNRAVVLHFENSRIVAVVAHSGAGGVEVTAVVDVPFDEAGEGAAAERLAEALSSHRANRLPVIFAFSRDDLQWQSYEVPPAPEDELPDLVLMQAERDFAISEDGVGLDFLPLDGDEQRPYRVVTIGVPSDLAQRQRMQRRRMLCDEAGLKVRRITAECLGWPALMRQSSVSTSEKLDVGLAIAKGHAELWACEGDKIKLVRSVHLPVDAPVEATVGVLGSEIRRTLLALGQLKGARPVERLKCYADAVASPVVSQLQAMLPIEVEHVDPASVVVTPPDVPPSETMEIAPLAALAADEAAGIAPPIDLLNPRRRPAPPSRRNTYALAGAAAVLLAALVGWHGYRAIEDPREAAALANDETEALAETLDVYEEDQQRVAEIKRWFAGSVNLLDELEIIGLQTRPKPLDDSEFAAAQDVVIDNFEASGTEITLRALAKNVGAVLPLESRLRDGKHTVDRARVDAEGGNLSDYKVLFEEQIQRVDMPAAGAGS